MTFYSNFSDIHGKRYEVEITSESSGDDVNLIMSNKPCIIKSSSTKLFDPIKSRACSLKFRSTDWHFDLYEPSTRGTRVKVYEYDENAQYHQGKVIFRGFLTPCAYTQSFTYSDEITLNAVDGISTSKDFKWDWESHNGVFMTFFDILLAILRPCNYSGTLYVPYTYTKLNTNNITTDILKSLYANSNNFVDDDEERTPWKEYEIVEEIMQFLGWTLVPDGDDVWLIDYKAAAEGPVKYFKYDIQTGDSLGDFTSPATDVEIDLDNAAAGKANISIDDIYNKISISDNLYKIDEISPDLMEDNLHVSVTDEAGLGDTSGPSQSKWSKVRRKHFLWWEWEDGKTYQEGTDYCTFCRLKPESGWTHYYYRMNDLQPNGCSDPNAIDFNETGYYSETVAEDDKQKKWINTQAENNGQNIDKPNINEKVNTHGCLIQHYAYVDESHPNNVPSSIDWSDILTFFVTGPSMVSTEYKNLQKKVLEYNINEEIQWKPASGTSWITIKSSIFYQFGTSYKEDKKDMVLTVINKDKGWYATTPVDKSLSSLPQDYNYGGFLCTRKESTPDYGIGFKLWKMRLQIGDKYWDGNNKVWTTTPSYFWLSFNNNPDNEKDEFVQAFAWMDTVNNTNYKDKVGEDAYAIPIKAEDIDNINSPSFGKLKLTIYTPSVVPQELEQQYKEWWGIDTGDCVVSWDIVPPVIYVKDFKLGYIYTNTDVWYNNHEDSNNTDKVYTGWINERFKKDFSDLQFKLNTALPEKPIARSFVTTPSGYLKTMKHLNNEEKTQEYNIVDIYLDHHSDRKPIYEQNVHGFFKPYETFNKEYDRSDGTSDDLGKLVLDSQTYDVAADNNRIKIIAF